MKNDDKWEILDGCKADLTKATYSEKEIKDWNDALEESSKGLCPPTIFNEEFYNKINIEDLTHE